MALKKSEKASLIKKFGDIVKKSASVVFVSFRGLSVNDTNAMRRKLREQNIGYRVVKKTLLGRALDELAPAGETLALSGEVAMAYGTDNLAPAREVYGSVKEYRDKLSILGGIFEGVFKNAAEMTELAMIPPREILLGRLLYLLNSPIQRMAIAVSEVAKGKGTSN